MLDKLQEILDKLPEKYRDKLIEELSIITDNDAADFMPYFLTLKEITDIAKAENILKGPVRGSAAASIVCYLFGITDIDPLVYDLPLKRFISLSRLRRSVPDVDLDYPKGKRDTINKILFDKYKDRIAFVATFSMMKIKNSLMDAWRINIIQPTEFKIHKLKEQDKKDEAISLKNHLDNITKEFTKIRKSLGNLPVGFTDLEWLEGCTKDETYHPGLLETNAAFKEWTAQYSQVLETAKGLLAIPRSIGQHAAGVVISDIPLYEILPVMKTKEGYNVIAYDKKTVQKLGFIKFDNLGLNTLNFISDTLDRLKVKGIELDPWDLPEDPEVYIEYLDGACRTLFQFDTHGGASFAKKMKPKSKKDLFAGVALNRPGSLDASIKLSNDEEVIAADAYIQRMHGDLDIEYLHDDLIPILKDTYGVMVYQENVAKTIQDLLGYSEEEADTIRGAISDKNPAAFEEVKKRLPMLLERGWTQEQADRLYETLLAFARYSFNLSHSAGYGLTSYTTAYLKHYYPLEWWVSVLSHETPDQVTEHFWPEICHLIDEPNVNISKDKYELHNGRIIPPLNLINGVGAEAIKDISSKAPFSSIEDFIQRIDGRKVNKRVVLSLLKAGAMNILFEDKKTLVEKVKEYLILKAFKEGKKRPEEMPEEFNNLNPYREYLLAKSVLPVSTISLTDSILSTNEINKPLVKRGNQWYLRGQAPLFDGAKLHETLIHHKELESSVEFVSYGYVIAVRRFPYHSEAYNMDKIGMELILDFDGKRVKTNCWPRKADKEPLLMNYIKENTVYLFNIRIQPDENWKFSLIGLDEIKEKPIPKQEPAQGELFKKENHT